MKLEITRGLFLAGALIVTAIATAAWQEPAPRIVHSSECIASSVPCPAPAQRRQAQVGATPDANLLLLMFGLTHAMKGEQ